MAIKTPETPINRPCLATKFAVPKNEKITAKRKSNLKTSPGTFEETLEVGRIISLYNTFALLPTYQQVNILNINNSQF